MRGLSGCTFEEEVRWGKERPESKKLQCFCDITIALPNRFGIDDIRNSEKMNGDDNNKTECLICGSPQIRLLKAKEMECAFSRKKIHCGYTEKTPDCNKTLCPYYFEESKKEKNT